MIIFVCEFSTYLLNLYCIHISVFVMKILIILVCFLMFYNCNSLNANVNIKFRVLTKTIPDTSNIFITGNHDQLGNWTPDNVRLIKKDNYIWQITLSFPVNTELAFKFTRGDWNTEAMDTNGGVPPNHTFTVKNDTTIEFQIDQWKDRFISLNGRKITGNFQVHQKLDFPGLKPRDVIVWLPPGYESNSEKRYPVLYMHDGQNLFDPNTSFQGLDWQVDETADSLIKNNEIDPMIIVGIYNTSDRNEEYSDTPLGKKYANFLINKLKLFIDKNYRTLPGAINTAVGGSSMGGLISFILVWEHPQIFSKAICMSPAFKIDQIDYIKQVKQHTGSKNNIRIYIYNGGLDLEKELQPGIDEMVNILKKKDYVPDIDLFWFKEKTASHNESAWAQYFWQPLKIFYKKR